MVVTLNKRLVKRFLVIGSLLALFSCHSSKEVAATSNTTIQQKIIPSWVNQRPISTTKFIGIGVSAKKGNTIYQTEAKKNALYDLASEIKVDVSTNSILHTVQNNNQFNENFNSLIQLSNSDNLEGYNLLDTYETESECWVYYELDKASYKSSKERKKQFAIDQAVSLLTVANDEVLLGNYTSALKKRISAFFVLIPYLNEELNFSTAQKSPVNSVFELTSLIETQLKEINYLLSKEYPLIKANQVKYSPFIIKVNAKKQPLSNFPFSVIPDLDKIQFSSSVYSQYDGSIAMQPIAVPALNELTSLKLMPDLNKLMNQDSTNTINLQVLNKFIQLPKQDVFIRLEPISVAIISTEKNVNLELHLKEIQPFLADKLQKSEVRIVEDECNADYVIEVSSNTIKDISSQDLTNAYKFQLANLSVVLKLRNVKNRELLSSIQVANIYGYASSIESAGMNAYYNPKLKTELKEALFLLKQKMIAY